jgi:hypothetical protein
MDVAPGKVIPVTALVRVPEANMVGEIMPIVFKGKVESNDRIQVRYQSMFMGPKK